VKSTLTIHTSEVRASAMQLLLILINLKNTSYGCAKMAYVRETFCNNPSNFSKFHLRKTQAHKIIDGDLRNFVLLFR
jgi:hypothetical protein